MKLLVKCPECKVWVALASCKVEQRNGDVYYYDDESHHVATLSLPEVN